MTTIVNCPHLSCVWFFVIFENVTLAEDRVPCGGWVQIQNRFFDQIENESSGSNSQQDSVPSVSFAPEDKNSNNNNQKSKIGEKRKSGNSKRDSLLEGDTVPSATSREPNQVTWMMQQHHNKVFVAVNIDIYVKMWQLL